MSAEQEICIRHRLCSCTLQKTGLHPIDGACYLKSHNQNRLASLVAYHSGAQFEAKLRGLSEELKQFPYEYSLISDALTFCDMTTNPTGKQVSFQERIEDIFNRYDETHIVFQALQLAKPVWKQTIDRVQEALHKQGFV